MCLWLCVDLPIYIYFTFATSFGDICLDVLALFLKIYANNRVDRYNTCRLCTQSLIFLTIVLVLRVWCECRTPYRAPEDRCAPSEKPTYQPVRQTKQLKQIHFINQLLITSLYVVDPLVQ